jgi:photosystem II stability/assembly factor-like uncharacterized protein
MRVKQRFVLATVAVTIAGGTIAALQAQKPARPHASANASVATQAAAAPAAPSKPAVAASAAVSKHATPAKAVKSSHPARAVQKVKKPSATAPALVAENDAEKGPARGESMREWLLERRLATTPGGFDTKNEGKGWAEWFYGQRALPNSSIPPSVLAQEYEKAKKNKGNHGGKTKGAVTPFWSEIGPSHVPDGQTDVTVGPRNTVSGRVSAIAVDPTDPSIVYTGGAQGGIWKSTNGGATWKAKSDNEASLAVGDIAIDPIDPSIIYVGTGEANGSCDSYYGAGILRSTDGGDTWTLLGGTPSLGQAGAPFAGQSISKLIIDPDSAGSPTGTIVWASTARAFLSSGTEQCIAAPETWNGALWRSTDSGSTWQLQDVPTGVAAPGNRVHDVVMDPSNHDVLFVGVRTQGIFKTTNARDLSGPSATFTKLNGGLPDWSTAFPFISRITLGISQNGQTIYAALEEGQLFSNLWGLFSSTDGGNTWQHEDRAVAGIITSTYDSINKVHILQRKSGPAFPPHLAGYHIILDDNSGVSPFPQQRVIAQVLDPFRVVLSASVIPSTFLPDGDYHYSISGYPRFCDGQCFYDMTIGVDPTDPTGATLYVGGNPHSFPEDHALTGVPGRHSLWKSTDFAETWTSISQGDAVAGGIHTDDHEIVFDGLGTVYDGNDGGVWKSTDAGATWTNLNTNIAIQQYQGVALHPTNGAILIGGTQDNGTNERNPALEAPPVFFHTDDGDGGQSLIDQSTPSTMFHTYFNARRSFAGPSKSTDGGTGGPATWHFVGGYYYPASNPTAYSNGLDLTERLSFYIPMAQHPGYSPNVVYLGLNHLYRSADPHPPCCPTQDQPPDFCTVTGCTTPDSWTKVSPLLTKGGSAFISAIGVLPNLVAGKEVIYTGASDGRIKVSSTIDATSTDTATWTTIDPGAISRFVTDIFVDPADPTGNTAYFTYSGFGSLGHVYKTTNGLSGSPVLTNISGDFPNLPANGVALTPLGLFVGSDIGVFQSTNGGVNWVLTDGMPNVTAFGLKWNATTSTLVAATHGRGMFQFGTTAPCIPGDVDGSTVVDVNDVFYLINYLFAGGPAPTCAGSGNVSGDSITDVNDVFYLINYLFAGGPAPI